ncbi:MAG: ABC transporter ATP-binding protein [Thermoleophilia bacterium]
MAVEAPPAEAIARVEGVSLTLRRGAEDRTVLRDVDLAIRPGEIMGLVGESGSGKSVLALAMMGLLPQGAHPRLTGRIEVAGVDMVGGRPEELRAVRRHGLGVIFQDPMTSLNPTMRVGRQITEAGVDAAEGVRLLTAVGVTQPELRMQVFPHELSGGLRQRVMAAIALSGSPSLIIADEPTTALDVTVQAQLLRLLTDLRDEFGCAILFITHDLAVAAQITDRVTVMYAGRVAERGPTGAVLARPVHPYTAGLLGSRLSLHTPRDRALPTLRAAQGDVLAIPGCAYHPRCPVAEARCATEVPALEPAGDGDHLRSCWRPPGEVVALASVDTGAVERPAADAGRGPVIAAQGITCTFTVKSGGGRREEIHALRGVDLTVDAGEALSIVGESGSGKSTLLRVIAGLLTPTAGTVAVDGAVQMVFQDAGSSLTPWMRVGELLRERLHPLGLAAAEARDRVEAALTGIGLPAETARARPAQLSGGQRQRVALARATIIPPAVLLCDEPTSALDASLAATVLNLIRGMRAELGMAVVFVTHDMSVARLMGDRVGVMRAGELVEIGPAERVLHAPEHEYTRTLLAAVPQIPTDEEAAT